MRKKPANPKQRTRQPGSDTDTASYDELQGVPDPRSKPDGRNAKMPHERDESARGMGNRLDEALPPSEREISQAHADIERGLVDTERRGIPNDLPRKARRDS
jgi:hypothetical protein